MESSLQSNPVLACIKELEASITTKLAHVAKAQGDNQLHHHRRIAFRYRYCGNEQTEPSKCTCYERKSY